MTYLERQLRSQEAIHRAIVTGPIGTFEIAAMVDKGNPKSDLLTAANALFRCHYGLIRVKNIRKSNRRVVAGMTPITGCETWAWYRRIS